MSQLRLDPLTGRWVVVTLERAGRPQSFGTRVLPVESDPVRPCPFCPGNEEATPPALETYGPGGQWVVRVVPNLYPAFDGHEQMAVEHIGPVFTQAPAGGIHEVLVLSPGHNDGWADLPDHHAGLIMAAIRDRFEEHSTAWGGGLRYSQAIVNAGREAGASLEHPHGQLLGMPFVPSEIVAEQAGFARFSGNCLLCATIDAEEGEGHRVVHADSDAIVVCPYWSGTPYEMLVLPRHHEAHLHHAGPGDVAAVGRAIRDALLRMRSRLADVAYNVVFHSAPYRSTGAYHWHVHLLPKVATRAGFELGTGVLINLVPPELAAYELREASVRA
ncbi:MAG TPA: galactose-1-phosphate uridylyltransferase [Acidimicrobiales bacterium]|nr:galactose-1-phosphate uridylyltransferase [Acidimicrobiales bacterium]